MRNGEERDQTVESFKIVRIKRSINCTRSGGEEGAGAGCHRIAMNRKIKKVSIR